MYVTYMHLGRTAALIAAIPSPCHHELSDLLELGSSTGYICPLAGLYDCTNVQQASLETAQGTHFWEAPSRLCSNVGDQCKSNRWARFSVMLS